MKRKRAFENSDKPEETIKTKKRKSQLSSVGNDELNLDIKSEQKADLNIESDSKIRKRKSRKTASKDSKSDSISGPTSSASIEFTNISSKEKRKAKADINQNGDLAAMRETYFSKSAKDEDLNGFPNRAGSDSPSDLQPLGQMLKEDELSKQSHIFQDQDSSIKNEKSSTPPTKNKSGRKLSILPKSKLVSHVQYETESNGNAANLASESPKKAKKKVRIDETESLKIKQELLDAEPHFSVKELPAKIIKSKLNKNLTEEVKVSPLTIEDIKQEIEEYGLPKSEIEKKDKHSLKSEPSRYDYDHLHQELEIKEDNGTSLTSEDSDLEVYYINKNAEKEAKKKLFKESILMSKEDQLVLVQRLQEFIPQGDTKSYKYRVRNLDWQKIAFQNYTVEDCKQVWGQLLKKVRHYRILAEVASDVKQVIERFDLEEIKAKKTKYKTKKHPDMPKRPLTSYFLYYIRKRDDLAKERPDLDTVELNKFISEKYQSLSLEKKQKYELLAAKNREEYKKKLEEFYIKHPEMRKVVIKKERKEGKEKPPKRPDNPFRLFMHSESNREEIADDDKTEFKEVCREKWRQMTDEKKLGWINLAEEHHLKYEEEVKEYMSRHPEYIPKRQSHKPLLSREEINLKDKLAGKPKKPPGTAYGLFISVTLQSSEIGSIPPRERWNYTSTKWKAMTEEEREQYKLLLNQVQEQYKRDFQAYLESLPEDKRQAEIQQNLPKRKKSSTAPKPSTSGIKRNLTATRSQPSRSRSKKQKIQNPIPPPRSVYKYFAEKYEGENSKEAWKSLRSQEKEKYEEELAIIKDKYIKDFEAYLKSLSKEQLAVFCANRNTQEEYSSSDVSESESDHVDENTSDAISNISDYDSEEN